MKKKKHNFGISIDELAGKIDSLKKEGKDKLKESSFLKGKKKQLIKDNIRETIDKKLQSELQEIITKNKKSNPDNS